ncbi:MAG: cysteine--tRNA ligase [Thaumarchaeota archaeon]|nr:cysteine--tRNA ligase [Nitrososphaerota archaeon]
MTIRLYNSYGRKLMAFRPLVKGQVRMYTCGPTVWNYAHVGNLRTFLFEDLLRRYLKFSGYKVVQVKNITDVEDKIIKGMKQFGKSLKELTEFYAAAFMEDLSTLRIERAEYYPRATEHISEMLVLIKRLKEKGLAYQGEDRSIYYDISKFKRYGKLSGVRVRELKEGARVSQDHYEKEEAHDFALWKRWDEDDGEVFWQTEFGKGRPGWHIECSAMSTKYLGESFDIHTGGKDLRFPHHENEIAQSEGASGKRLAKYWLHAEFLKVNGEEMHKSAGNLVTLRQLLEKRWSPRAIRLFLMSAHYREELNLTDDSLRQADVNISRIDQTIRRLRMIAREGAVSQQTKRLTSQFLTGFKRAMDNDLGTPKALAAFFTFIRGVNAQLDGGSLSTTDSKTIIDAISKADAVLGVIATEDESLPKDLQELISERDEARKKRDYKRADEIREILRKEGILLQDSPKGTTWSRAHTA